MLSGHEETMKKSGEPVASATRNRVETDVVYGVAPLLSVAS